MGHPSHPGFRHFLHPARPGPHRRPHPGLLRPDTPCRSPDLRVRCRTDRGSLLAEHRDDDRGRGRYVNGDRLRSWSAWPGGVAGVAGFILKDAAFEDLLGTIRSVAAGRKVLPAEMTSTLFSRIAEEALRRGRHTTTAATDLTEREQEVVDLIARGFSNKAIAAELRVSPHPDPQLQPLRQSGHQRQDVRPGAGELPALAKPAAGEAGGSGAAVSGRARTGAGRAGGHDADPLRGGLHPLPRLRGSGNGGGPAPPFPSVPLAALWGGPPGLLQQDPRTIDSGALGSLRSLRYRPSTNSGALRARVACSKA